MSQLKDADLISRKEAVSRISDLIVLELRCERIPTWNEVYKALNDLPTVDAEIVVRCQNCKHHGSCGYEDIPGWFCADGERESNEY